jgi:FixJ family two-component response regulator
VGCLILDLHMPEVNGFDLLTEFGLRQITVPVVVLTGHDEPGSEERTLTLGAVAYLTKPVDELALIAAIKSAMAAE